MNGAALKEVKKQPRKKPDFSGVPGELVKLEGLELDFSTRKAGRGSPYDDLLAKLAEAGIGAALKFGDLRARNSVSIRARKKGFVVAFAEQGNALYVKIVGKLDDQKRQKRDENILVVLAKYGPQTPIRVAVKLREEFDDSLIDGPTADVILSKLFNDGKVQRLEGNAYRIIEKKKY